MLREIPETVMFSGIFFVIVSLCPCMKRIVGQMKEILQMSLFLICKTGENERLLCRYLAMFRRLSAIRPDDEPLLSGRHGIVTIENAPLLSMMTSLCFRGGQTVYLRASLNV